MLYWNTVTGLSAQGFCELSHQNPYIRSMDKTSGKLAIWTLVTNLFIGIGVGHGLSPVFLTEFLLPFIPKQDFHFMLFGFHDNDDQALSAVIIFVIGQAFLLAYLFVKRPFLIFLSLAILWSGLVLLFYNFGAIMSLFALPFIILSIILFIRLLNNRYPGTNEVD